MISIFPPPSGRRRTLSSAATVRRMGFSLIEVMIAVLIIAVLAAIAYPSYDNHVTNSRRAAAAGCLMERAQFMERYYTTNMSYADAPDPAQCQDLQGHYAISLPAASLGERTYTLQAEPQGRQASKDTRCGTLSLTHQGVRGVSGSGSVDQCW